jgi:hypothetical protein
VAPSGDEVPYPEGSKYRFRINAVTEVIISGVSGFTEVGGRGTIEGSFWYPADLFIGMNHPGDLSFRGQTGNRADSDYGRDTQRLYLVRSFARKALIVGEVVPDDSRPSGGISYHSLNLGLSNIVPRSRPATSTSHKRK